MPAPHTILPRLAAAATITTVLVACGSTTSASTTHSTVTMTSTPMTSSSAPAVGTPTGTPDPTSATPAASTIVTPSTQASGRVHPDGTVLNLKAVVRSSSQIPGRLAGTTATFQDVVRRDLTAGGSSHGCSTEVQVDRYVVDSWAQGSTGSTCSGGGAVAYWYQQGGAWHELDTQNVLLCSDLEAKGVPAAPPAIDLQCGAMGDTSSVHYAGAGTARRLLATPVLGGAPSQSGGLTGLGEVRPSSVNFGGDGTSYIEDVTWDTWGGPQADGRGTANWAPANGPLADARPVAARVRAFDLGTCNGRTAYRKLAWWWPSKGETFASAVKRLEGGYSICRGA